MPEVEEYTIGWICALTKELIAAKAFLDVVHDSVNNAAVNDDNKYTLGSIGKHNVVIAVLPYGQYGLVNAAAALKDMTRTFSNLRAVLMVGIGGGAPGIKDIRLSDIVVGSPGRNNSGVIQYDYGRAVQGEEFAVTSHLNQPPIAFLTAMSALHATYEMEGHSIESDIDKALQKYKRLSNKYKRPAVSTDRLYEADFVHQGSEGVACGESCGDDKLVYRDTRGDDENNPAIHRGLIASGNSLMKDAPLRDKLAAKHGILCFEMEASGLMNHFPCVIIRGICDYSDSHKNDQWQQYAAMAAAAYARDLLLEIAPSSMLKEERIETLLGQLNGKVEDIRHIATESSRDIKSLSSTVRDDSISAWLDPADPSVDHNKAREVCHSGTGRWLLDSPQYITWKSQKNSFLWLKGKSGQGKTILSSTIIEDIRNSPPGNCAILYFYITFADHRKRSLEAILRSLINQLYRSRQESRSPIDALYSKCGDGSSQATVGQLRYAFRDMLSSPGDIYIVIDALDEYRNRSTQRDELLSWIESLCNGEFKTHLLVTSRPEHDVKTSIETWADPYSIICLETENISRDISDYIRQVVTNSTSLRRWHEHTAIQDEIINSLTAKADRVFRWVALQLERLKDCINKEEVNTTLQTLPTTLEETYYRVLYELTHTRRKYVIRILQFLAYSDIPLTLEGAVDAIAINLTAPPGSRFIIKDHASVMGYTPPRWLGHALLVAAEFGRSNVVELLIREGANVNTEGRMHNVLCTAVAAGHMDIIELLIKNGADVNAQQVVYGNALEVATDVKAQSLFSNALYSASYSGRLDIVEYLVENGANVNAQSIHGTAVQAASRRGYLDIVRFLVKKGAGVNAPAGKFGNGLLLASHAGNFDLIQYLGDQGARVENIDTESGMGSRAAWPLICLAQKGDDATAAALFILIC
ncbi:ankyrin repeat [Fusarium subglutinans]|uniref:Ankyrin repeat n=1 Tax=Gibberella subglutinans TaxID=42677 RepID=A0A8H5P7S0_GIBSU|nr:ankyrin repeat [Fusarium subglutinans]KAF5591594.1 ankyrin repeat [Fusarium subglutinans]